MNKKIVSLLMAAALTTGMGGYGTLAYFSDKAEVNEHISITMGTLDVDAKFTTEWDIPDGKDTEAKFEGGVFTNVRPGDRFWRDIIVENVGTLNANTTIQLNNIIDSKDVNIELVLLGNDNTGIIETSKNKAYSVNMESGKAYKFRLKININPAMEAGTIEQIFNAKADEIVTISAKQNGIPR